MLKDRFVGLLELTWGVFIQNPGLTISYSGHIQNATVARLSPSGYYCASADITGKGGVIYVIGPELYTC